MAVVHKELAEGRWHTMSLSEQMANIGAEVGRAINWRRKGDKEYAMQAFERALELFDLTLTDPNRSRQYKEIARAREVWCDYFVGMNRYQSTDDQLANYFYQFTYAARASR